MTFGLTLYLYSSVGTEMLQVFEPPQSIQTNHTVTYDMPGLPNATASFMATFTSPYGINVFNDAEAFTSTASSIDVGARMLRQATSGTSWNQETRQVVWSEAATGVAPDVAFPAIQWNTSATSKIRWAVMQAYSGGSVQFPTLHIENDKDYNPKATDSVTTLQTFLASVPGGWDVVRRNPLPVLLGFVAPVKAAGTLTAELVQPAAQ